MTEPEAIPPALLDTDIFSEFLRGRNRIVAARAAAYQQVHQRFSIGAITLMEVCSGWCRRGQQERIDAILQLVLGWTILAVTADIASLAGRIDGDLIRIGQAIGIADALIAATAINQDLVLVTARYRIRHTT